MPEVSATKLHSLGQSGARLELVEAKNFGDRRILRKSSATPHTLNEVERNSSDSTSRLMLQAQLQEDASTSDLFRNFKIPKVLARDTVADSFDMEYLDALTLGESMAVVKPSDLLEIGDVLVSYFLEQAHKLRTSENEIESVVDKVTRFLENSPEARRYLGVGAQEAANLVERALAPTSKNSSAQFLFCSFGHGDFSLENILWEPRKRRLGLVDFLDGPLNGRLADAGRLYLDLRFGWWRNSRESSSTRASRQHLCKVIFGTLNQLGTGESRNFLGAAIRGSAFLSVARVLPYTILPRRRALLSYAGRELVRELREFS